jgi:hypothetical protein
MLVAKEIQVIRIVNPYACPGSSVFHVNQFVGLWVWQAIQQDRVDEAENCCVGANTKCKNQDGSNSEARRFKQQPECMTQAWQ